MRKKSDDISAIIIDKDQSSGLALAAVLRKNSYHVVHTKECFHALHEMQEESFDVAIVTTNITDMTTTEVITIMRDQYHIPILVITKEDELDEYYDDDNQPPWKTVVSRPYVPKDILDALKDILKG